MSLYNTRHSYGLVARALHWLTALLILTLLPLGLYANDLPYDTGEALARKAQLFSLHKTLGVAVFFVALARIVWTLTQPHPVALHPEKRAETLLAEVAHWTLYLSLVIVPLSGWVHHAATDGFAPILWPLGQSLPFVPTSESVAGVAEAMHFVFTKVLAATIALHFLGAMKHAIFDMDATLGRMTSGVSAGPDTERPRGIVPAAIAGVIYAAGAGLALALTPAIETVAPATPVAIAASQTSGNWQVTEGTLGITVQQLGSAVQGSFANWTADITFDEAAVDGQHGSVTVQIDTTSLTLGSVSDQAKSADFFDVANHPTATFTAPIVADGAGYVADGTLTLRGVTAPVTLPFTLTIAGETATMAGSTTLNRQTFGMGAGYPDGATVGLDVDVTVVLTATRK